MEHQFWHDKWDANEIGFHEGRPNALLTEYFASLNLPKGARVFVPLCGKTMDIPWLLSQGMQVVGAELSELAVRQLFEDMGVEPEVRPLGGLKVYEANALIIFVGDIFDIDADALGNVDAIFDRAALVALPPDLRARYAKHLMTITGNIQQLLITFEYDQGLMTPPPHSVSLSDVTALYGATYALNVLEERDIAGGLKGRVEAVEFATHLTPDRKSQN